MINVMSSIFILKFPFVDGDIPRASSYGIYTSQVIPFPKQCNWYDKLRKACFFTNFYRHHYDMVSTFNTGLKPMFKQGLSVLEFYGDLVYKLRKRVGRNAFFSDQFRKLIICYKQIGYIMNVMRQTACLLVNNFAALFNCTLASRASALMMAPA